MCWYSMERYCRETSNDDNGRLFCFRLIFLPHIYPFDDPRDVGLQVLRRFAPELYHNFTRIGRPSLFDDDFHDLRVVVFLNLFERIIPAQALA